MDSLHNNVIDTNTKSVQAKTQILTKFNGRHDGGGASKT